VENCRKAFNFIDKTLLKLVDTKIAMACVGNDNKTLLSVCLFFFTTDTIAQRGERLELLIDKAEDLNTTVSFQSVVISSVVNCW